MGKLVFCMTIMGVFSALQAAAATCPGTVVFQDTFTAANANLNVAPNGATSVSVAGGNATVTLANPNIGRGLIYFTDQYGDASVCTTFNTLATDKFEDQDGGVIFWAKDYTSYYAFFASPAKGSFAVLQMVPGSTSWATAIPWTASNAVQKVAGAANSVRVQTKGTQAMPVSYTHLHAIHGRAVWRRERVRNGERAGYGQSGRPGCGGDFLGCEQHQLLLL